MTRIGVLAAGLCVVACDKTPTEAASPAPPSSISVVEIAAPALAKSAVPVRLSVARSPNDSPVRGLLREITWHYGQTPVGPSDVVVVVPADALPGERFPVLVAFHGRGESLKGPTLGARGWVDDYTLSTTVRRLKEPPLTSDDLLGFVTTERLAALNAGLEAHPYRGLIVVCPYLPDEFRGAEGFEQGRKLAGFVVDDLLPRAYRETPALGTVASTGVDGVSLGGRASLLVGFLRPEAFGVVATLQPALDNADAGRFADLARLARIKNPTQRVRLLTSDGDYFLEPTHALAAALRTRAVSYELDVVTGPHSYEFNRGPGGYEMLAFHDQALR